MMRRNHARYNKPYGNGQKVGKATVNRTTNIVMTGGRIKEAKEGVNAERTHKSPKKGRTKPGGAHRDINRTTPEKHNHTSTTANHEYKKKPTTESTTNEGLRVTTKRDHGRDTT